MKIMKKIRKLFRKGNKYGDVLDVFNFMRFIMNGIEG